MIVEGNIEGLKMGTIYLQQYVNDKLTNIDSIVANGDGKIYFQTTFRKVLKFFTSTSI